MAGSLLLATQAADLVATPEAAGGPGPKAGFMLMRVSSLRGLGTPLADAIFRQEGSVDSSGNWITASLGYRLNNPGNLNYAGQPNCWATTQGNGLEAQCATLADGIAATENQLALDASRGLTLQERLSTWATGNQAAYVANVASWLGVSPDTPLASLLDGSSAATADSGVSGFDWMTAALWAAGGLGVLWLAKQIF